MVNVPSSCIFYDKIRLELNNKLNLKYDPFFIDFDLNSKTFRFNNPDPFICRLIVKHHIKQNDVRSVIFYFCLRLFDYKFYFNLFYIILGNAM